MSMRPSRQSMMLSARQPAARLLAWLAIVAMPWQIVPSSACGCSQGSRCSATVTCSEDDAGSGCCETKRCPCTGASVCRCGHSGGRSCCYGSTTRDSQRAEPCCGSQQTCCNVPGCCGGGANRSERSCCGGGSGCSCGDNCHCGEDSAPPAKPITPPTNDAPAERVLEAQAIASPINANLAVAREASPLATDALDMPQDAASTCVLLCRFTL